jgi:hypothetical protein
MRAGRQAHVSSRSDSSCSASAWRRMVIALGPTPWSSSKSTARCLVSCDRRVTPMPARARVAGAPMRGSWSVRVAPLLLFRSAHTIRTFGLSSRRGRKLARHSGMFGLEDFGDGAAGVEASGDGGERRHHEHGHRHLALELCEVELGEPFGVGEEVELDDLPVLDRDGGDREGSSVEEGDHPGGAVDERPPHGQVDP